MDEMINGHATNATMNMTKFASFFSFFFNTGGKCVFIPTADIPSYVSVDLLVKLSLNYKT